ncbi:unnamed protein product, partial [Musa banksii]
SICFLSTASLVYSDSKKRNLVFFSIAVGKALSSFSVWCYKKQLKFQNSLLFLSDFMGCGFSRMSSGTPPELA